MINVDEIIGSLDKDQATKVIDFLKSKTAPAPVEPVKEDTPSAVEPTEPKTKTSEEMVEDLKKKTAKAPADAKA